MSWLGESKIVVALTFFQLNNIFLSFVRMKREVASSVVERGVAERVRLKQTYDKRTDDLQKQHESVRNALTEHRNKVG